jgi:two-component system, OmpR family, response regulator VanR
MKPKTIVVADDEPDMANLVKEALERHGYHVVTVFDGKTAIETITRLQPDLVVLDVLMPAVQGYDVCRYLRDQWELKKLKILILSSMSSEFDLEASRSAGADSYITKPFEPETLAREVKRLLESAE